MTWMKGHSEHVVGRCVLWVFLALSYLAGGAPSHASDSAGSNDEPHRWAVVDGGAFLSDAGTVTHPPINEMSGIVRSGTYRDVWWVHNDSGSGANLYAVDRDGKLVMPAWQREGFAADKIEGDKPPWPGVVILGAANQDWEDIDRIDDRLLICDMGNNGNAKRDLGVYVISEPNPSEMDQGARPITFIQLAYPDQQDYPPMPPEDWRFDCEAVFVADGKLYLLTKYRADCRFDRITTGTSLYRLDTMAPNRVNQLTLIHRADDLSIIPTAANLSPDGSRLAVMSMNGVWLFDKPKKGDDWLSGSATLVRLPMLRIKQAEGVCWDDDRTLRIVIEQRGVLTLDVGTLDAGVLEREP